MTVDGDEELIKKPLAIDLLLMIDCLGSGCTKSEIMRSYHDLMTKTVYYRLCEMHDLEWIEYLSDDQTKNRIHFTDKGYSVLYAVLTMLRDLGRL